MIQRNSFSAGAQALPAFAVLFDLDGTLVDSERSWLEAVRAYAADAGLSLSPEVVRTFQGVSVEDASRRLKAVHGITASTRDIGDALESRSIAAFCGRLRWLHGADHAVRGMREAGVRLGLVTSSTQRWVNAVQEHIQLGSFEVMITADDVDRTKPSPDPYVEAAKRLGVSTESCLVFEDSPVGVRAALDAGCQVVRVGAAEGLDGQRDTHQIADFSRVNAAWVRAILSDDGALRSLSNF